MIQWVSVVILVLHFSKALLGMKGVSYTNKETKITITLQWIHQMESLSTFGWKKKNEPRHDKTTKISVPPVQSRINLGIRPVWSESSLCTQWVAKDPRFLHADSDAQADLSLCWVHSDIVGFVMSRLEQRSVLVLYKFIIDSIFK